MEGRTAFDNLRAAGGRAPGNLVSAGLGRAQKTADDGFAQVISPEITETSSTISIGDQIRSDVSAIVVQAFDDIVQQFIQIILGLATQWLADIGFMPSLSLDSLLPGADSGSADDTDADTVDTGDVADQTSGDSSATQTDSTDTGTADADSTTTETPDADATDSNGGRTPGRGGR